MGAATSSNVAESVMKVQNSVNQTTETSQSQGGSNNQYVEISEGCNMDVKGDVNIENANQFAAQSKQIVSATQTTDINNKLAQETMQEAKSTVGSLGLGYSSASNYASQFASSTNTVSNVMNTTSDQFFQGDQSFVCNGSLTVGGDFNLLNKNSTDFTSEQVIDNQQTAKIVNDLSQTIDQKAVATVEGLAALLAGLILLLLAPFIGVAIVGGSPSGKFLIMSIALFLIIAVCIFVYFEVGGDDRDCTGAGGMLNDGCDGECINIKEEEIKMKAPPVRYLGSILEPAFIEGAEQNSLSSPPFSLLGLISSSGGDSNIYENNGGYNAKTWLHNYLRLYEGDRGKILNQNHPDFNEFWAGSGWGGPKKDFPSTMTLRFSENSTDDTLYWIYPPWLARKTMTSRDTDIYITCNDDDVCGASCSPGILTKVTDIPNTTTDDGDTGSFCDPNQTGGDNCAVVEIDGITKINLLDYATLVKGGTSAQEAIDQVFGSTGEWVFDYQTWTDWRNDNRSESLPKNPGNLDYILSLIMAKPDTEGIQTYMSGGTDSLEYTSLVRYILSDMSSMTIPLDTYISDFEIVNVRQEKDGIPSAITAHKANLMFNDDKIQYRPIRWKPGIEGTDIAQYMLDGFKTSGSIIGYLGICEDTKSKTARAIKITAPSIAGVLFFAWVIFAYKFATGKGGKKPKKE